MAASTSAAANMDPSGERERQRLCVFQQQQQQQQQLDEHMRQYQGYSVRTFHMEPNQEEDGRIEDENDGGSEDEEVDYQLEKMLLRPPPAPVPGQLEKFHHQLRVGCFVATVEVLTDRSVDDLENIRKNAQKTVDELIKSTGEETEDEIPGRPICGTPKIKRDLRRMAKHIDFFTDLMNKFIEEFDGSFDRVRKLRRATGYIKGVLARDGQDVFNITNKPTITENSDLLDLFKINAMLFIEYIKSHDTQQQT